MNLLNLQSEIKSFDNKVASLKGRVDTLEEQYVSSQDNLIALKEKQVEITQAIELLNIIQTANKEVIKQMFENVVTRALQFINQTDKCGFQLNFDTRGNLPTLDFWLKTEDMQEFHNILNTSSGGDRDIVALALREVLLEVSKVPGFLFIDECEKRLDSPEKKEKTIEFIKELQKESKRQVFIITHADTMVNAVQNPIILKKLSQKDAIICDKCSSNNGHLGEIDIKENKHIGSDFNDFLKEEASNEVKKKRGRPKGGSKNKSG